MYIKASHITNLTDARYFAARSVAYLGFCLEEGAPHYIEPEAMKAICEWVSGPRIVGEFERASAEFVREAAAFFALDAVQVSTAALLPDLEGLEVLFCSREANDPDTTAAVVERAAPYASFCLIALTEAAAWKAVKDAEMAKAWRHLCAKVPVMLDVPLPLDALQTLLRAVQPKGFVLKGSAEERPGFKSFEEIDALFEALDL